MHHVRVLSCALSVVALLATAACSSSGDADSDSPRDERLERAKELCTTRCELEIAADCDSTPENYLSGCVALCSDKYRYYAECDAELTQLDTCRVERGTYACDGTGYPVIGPIGVCGSEGEDCTACTGSNLLSCL
jgi:hypothetical protein